jgi:hypothetical protein
MTRELRELVFFTESSLWRDEALLAFMCRGKKEPLHLYKGISQTKQTLDSGMAREMNWCLPTYKKYGQQLRGYLEDMIFFYNPEKARADVRYKAVFTGFKEMASVRLLHARGCRLTTGKMAESLLKRGLQFGIPEFVQQAAFFLRDFHFWQDSSRKLYDHYDKLHLEYKYWADAEQLSIRLLQHAGWNYRTRIGASAINPNHTLDSLSQLAPFLDGNPSVLFRVHFHQIKNQYLQETQNWSGVVANCAEAIEVLNTHPFPLNHFKSIFCYSRVLAFLRLGDLVGGQEAAMQGIQLAAEGSSAWFNAQRVYGYLHLASGDYSAAASIYNQISSKYKSRSALPSELDQWIIFGAFCFLLNELTNSNLPDNFEKFKSVKFSNAIRKLNTDKDGMHNIVVIIQYLLQFLEGKDLALLDRISSLKKHRQRHLLRKPALQRVDIFFRFLLFFARHTYEEDLLREKCLPLLRELKALPATSIRQPYELEIVPFDTLGCLLLNRVCKKQLAPP